MGKISFLISLLCTAAIGYTVYQETGLWTAASIMVVFIIVNIVTITLAEFRNRINKLESQIIKLETEPANISSSDNFTFVRGTLTTEERELAMRGVNGDNEALYTFLEGRSAKPDSDFSDVPIPVLVGIVQHICNDAEENDKNNEWSDIISDDSPPN